MKGRHKKLLAGMLAVMLFMPVGGQAVFAKTADQTQLDAGGGAQAESYTVSFRARKGKKVKKTLTLATGDTYGKLPKTSREGYQFKGWYTKKSGGKRIKAKSVFTGTADQVLYAHWKKLGEEQPSGDSGEAPEGTGGNTTEAPDQPIGGNGDVPVQPGVPGAEAPDQPGTANGDTGAVPEPSPGNTGETPAQPQEPGQSDMLVAYVPNADIDYKQNDYSDFVVLKNFKPEYLYCQYDYKRFVNSSGKNVGCTATADAMLASIYMDKAFSPNDEGWISGVGATWTNSVIADGTKKYSVGEQCAATFDYLNEGKPVLIRVIGHSVTAIGVRGGVGRDALTPADILIADPADGKVKRADEMGYRVMTDANGWGLRIPKKTLAAG